MKLFRRQKSDQPVIPPELQPYYGMPASRAKHIMVLVIVAMVIIAVLLVLSGWWLWQGTHGDNSPASKPQNHSSTTKNDESQDWLAPSRRTKN